MYCQSYSRWVEAEQNLVSFGMLIYEPFLGSGRSADKVKATDRVMRHYFATEH
jgi:hypothetical protein